MTNVHAVFIEKHGANDIVPGYVTTTRAAEILNCKMHSIHYMINSGRLLTKHYGPYVLVRMSDVEKQKHLKKNKKAQKS